MQSHVTVTERTESLETAEHKAEDNVQSKHRCSYRPSSPALPEAGRNKNNFTFAL